MDQPSPDLAALQNDIARKVGICIIRLQQYEQGMKELVTTSHFECSPGEPYQDVLARQRQEVARQTLGQIKNLLFESYLRSGKESKDPIHTETQLPEAAIRMTLRAALPDAELKTIKDRLERFIALRNELVHHFTRQFDLWLYEDCQRALSHLDSINSEIDERFEELHHWIDTSNQAKAEIAQLISEKSFKNLLIFGFRDTSSIRWLATTVVQQLKEIEANFSVGGWTSLAEATRTIQENWPELTPRVYGCKSWRNLIHETQLFEIQKRKPVQTGSTQIWFRSK